MRLRKASNEKWNCLHLHPPHQEQRQKKLLARDEIPWTISPPCGPPVARIFRAENRKALFADLPDIRLGSRRRTQKHAGWIEEAAAQSRAIGGTAIEGRRLRDRADASGGGLTEINERAARTSRALASGLTANGRKRTQMGFLNHGWTRIRCPRPQAQCMSAVIRSFKSYNLVGNRARFAIIRTCPTIFDLTYSRARLPRTSRWCVNWPRG